LLHVSWAVLLGTYINYYFFLMDWAFYHYKMSFFVIIFFLKPILSNISTANPAQSLHILKNLYCF
jgi:hypothetical protein